jgi:peptide alpha-N-acetyltransferase
MENSAKNPDFTLSEVTYRNFQSEDDLKLIISMIEKELSEPYPIFTYRYFLQKYPQYGIMAYHKDKCIGCIVSKLDTLKKMNEPDR